MNVVAGSGCSFVGLRLSWSRKCLWLMRCKFAGLWQLEERQMLWPALAVLCWPSLAVVK